MTIPTRTTTLEVHPRALAGALVFAMSVAACSDPSETVPDAASGPQLAISPTEFAFPGITSGEASDPQLFTVTSSGGSATGALGAAISGTDASQFTIVSGMNACQDVALADGESCTVAVSFTPSTSGAKVGALTIFGTPGGSAESSLAGTGLAPAQFALSSTSSDYGVVTTTTQSTVVTFTLTNTGESSSPIPSVSLSGVNASEFAIASNTCTSSLAPTGPSSSCTIGVRFEPTTPGAKFAWLNVTGTPGGTVKADLTGVGIAQAELVSNASSLTYAGVPVGDTGSSGAGAPQTITITNNGAVSSGVLSLSIMGTNAGDWSQTNTCTGALIAGGQCTVTVTYAPQAVGARAASLVISGTPGGTVTVGLADANALPRLEVLSLSTGAIVNPYDFGTDVIDTNSPRTVTVTIRNNTSTAQVVSNSETDVNNSYDPVAGSTCAPGQNPSVAAGATCTFTVAFDPLQPPGTQNASYLFSIPAAACPGIPTCNQAKQTFTGVGTINTLSITDAFGAQLPDATAQSHDFGSQSVSTSSTARVFRVINHSDSSSGTLVVDLAGSSFQITANGCAGVTLSGSATCDISVAFSPTSTGAKSGTLTVHTTTGSPTLGGTVIANLAGTGI